MIAKASIYGLAASLAKAVAGSWIALTNGIVGEGWALYRTVVDADLEGIGAKHLADASTRSSHGSRRCSIGLTRSVAVAPNGSSSAEGADQRRIGLKSNYTVAV